MARYPENQDLRQESVQYLENGIRARENRSSAWALLIVGGAGIVCVALGIVGLFPLQLGNPYLFYGVMMAVSLLFLVMGVLSMKSARIFAERAKVEGTLLETVEHWCMEAFKAEEIDAALRAEDGEPLYFQRVNYLKEQINSQFMNLDQRLLERFIDERLYEKLFEGLPEQADGVCDEDHHSLCG